MAEGHAGRFGIRIWGKPTLVLIAAQNLLMLLFWVAAPKGASYLVEPGSGRELLLTSVLGILYISFLWVLLQRYSRFSDKKPSRVTCFCVRLLTVLFALGILSGIFVYWHNNHAQTDLLKLNL